MKLELIKSTQDFLTAQAVKMALALSAILLLKAGISLAEKEAGK